MSIEIIPTGAALGAEIRGVDLARPIDDETFAGIERAYNDQRHETRSAHSTLRPHARYRDKAPQANDHDLRGSTADGRDQNLIASLKPHASVNLPVSQLSCRETQRVAHFSEAFSHGLGHQYAFRTLKRDGSIAP